MKAIVRRLRHLEAALAPRADPNTARAAEILRERRRRRLEASGQPFDIPVPSTTPTTGMYLSVAETMRQRRRLRLAQVDLGKC